MKNLQFKSFKAQVSDDGTVEGYASTYGNIDRVNDVVERGAFTKSLDTKQRSAPVRFLWQHDASRPIGVIEELKDDAKGLWFKARFANTTEGRDARENFLSGAVDSFSIGYQVTQSFREKRNGRMVNVLKEIKLHEISAVTFPANELALMTSIKSANAGELNEENRALVLSLITALLASQGSAAPAPEAVAEGEGQAEGADAAEAAGEAPVEAPEGEEQEAEAADEAEATEEAPADAEAQPEVAAEEEDEEEDEDKKLSLALEAYLSERRMAELEAYLATRKA